MSYGQHPSTGVAVRVVEDPQLAVRPPTDALIVALVTERLKTVDLTGETVAPATWSGEARLAQIPKKIKELMAAFKSGTVSGAVTWPAISDRDAEQAKLERERPTAPTRLVGASAEAFPSLDLDRQRAIVDALVEAVVLAKAERRGSPWTPDRLEVVWRA